MNYKSLLIFSALFTSGLYACDKDHGGCTNPDGFQYMIFGHFYGKCAGEACIEIFKFDNAQLFEDTLDHYPNYEQPYQGAYVLLPDLKFQAVKDLMNDIPAQLFSETAHVIGQPDAGDWGGAYIEIKYSDPAKSGWWLLDQNDYNMPQIYNAFVDKINEKIQIINN